METITENKASKIEKREQLWENTKKDAKQIFQKATQYPLFSLLLIIAVLLLIVVPHWQVSGIDNITSKADQENKDRATLAQILGGVAVLFTLYFAWGNLITAREGQITERFTKAVDQLGNKNMEVRLGGIYALERIANESDRDYWSIMEILTAYVRENYSLAIHPKRELIPECSINDEEKKFPLKTTKFEDVQAILTILGRRKHSFKNGEPQGLNLQNTNLQETVLSRANLSGANLSGANLSGAHFYETNLSKACLHEADLFKASLYMANLSEADISYTNLDGVNLKKAEGLSVEQFSNVKTLYNTKLDEKLEKPLREKYPDLFKEPNDVLS